MKNLKQLSLTQLKRLGNIYLEKYLYYHYSMVFEEINRRYLMLNKKYRERFIISNMFQPY